jgi:DNA-binding HxlR family transcriptional regulator
MLANKSLCWRASPRGYSPRQSFRNDSSLLKRSANRYDTANEDCKGSKHMSTVRRNTSANKSTSKSTSKLASSCVPTPNDSEYCPYFHHTIELLGRRWNGVILRLLLVHEQRFSELRSAIPGLSDRLLSERLHELEQEGLVERRVVDEIIHYRVSEKGSELEPVLQAITMFASQWAAKAPPSRPGRLLGQ